MARKGRKTNRKGRSKGEEQFIAMPHNVVKSDAWRSLSGPAVKVYLELHCRYWGGNNGMLYGAVDSRRSSGLAMGF